VEARCSVRIARGRLEEPEHPIRIVVGVQGAPGGEMAVREVAARGWPDGTKVKLVTAVSPGSLVGAGFGALVERLNEIHRRGLADLAASPLDVSAEVIEGDPRHALVEEAERWGADCIFVGTRDLTRTARWALGSVSSAVVTRAHCSVEIVRSPTSD
jgi:nucleotide-binding universal stress UspA family protein